MGDEIFDMELHLEKGPFERVRDWEAGAPDNEYRVTVHRMGSPDLHGTTTQTEDHNLEAKALVSRAAFDTAAGYDLANWSSMTGGEKTDAYKCYKGNASMIYLRVHRNSPPFLSPANVADSTISISDISDFNDAADLGESDFLIEVDGSSIGDWFDDLSSTQRGHFYDNFANR